MKSVMVHQFSQVPKADIPRSAFNRSRGYKTSLDVDYIYPVFLDEVLPGDTFNLNATLMCRVNTLVHPPMDNLRLSTFWFFVPCRLVWNNWQRFMGERDPDPDSSISYTIPQMDPGAGGFDPLLLGDYFGLPIDVANKKVNALPFRCYNRIYNEWFRDQNLIDSAHLDLDDGDDAIADYVLQKRAKAHDYFTSCLPDPQKGAEVDIPLGTDAPVLGIGAKNQTWAAGPVTAYESDSTTSSYANYKLFDHGDDNHEWYVEKKTGDSYPNIRADLSNATAATINSLREAFQLQRLLERDARGGTRYIEMIRAHFGVISPDARLQRSEYLGGNTVPFMITPIAQTSVTAATPQANLAATGLTVARNGFTKSFTEHGYLLGLVNVNADITYQQGLHKLWSRSTRYDFYWPVLSNLGEQSVLTQEIYCDGSATDDDVFGYQERWAEYRYGVSQITGQLRSTYATSLDSWHLSQEFGSAPTLSQTFIEQATPMDRIVATPAESQFLLDCHFDVKSVRPMPVYSVPGLIDHF